MILVQIWCDILRRLFRYTKSSAHAELFVFANIILSIVGVDVLGDPKECKVNGTPGRSSPTNKGGSNCKNSAVLFTFREFYGIITLGGYLLDKLEFDEENHE